MRANSELACVLSVLTPLGGGVFPYLLPTLLYFVSVG